MTRRKSLKDTITFDEMAECLLLTPEELSRLTISKLKKRWKMLNLPYAEVAMVTDQQEFVLITLGTL